MSEQTDAMALARLFCTKCGVDPDDRTSARRHAFVAALNLDLRCAKTGDVDLSTAEAALERLTPVLAVAAELADAALERAFAQGLAAGQELVAPDANR